MRHAVSATMDHERQQASTGEVSGSLDADLSAARATFRTRLAVIGLAAVVVASTVPAIVYSQSTCAVYSDFELCGTTIPDWLSCWYGNAETERIGQRFVVKTCGGEAVHAGNCGAACAYFDGRPIDAWRTTPAQCAGVPGSDAVPSCGDGADPCSTNNNSSCEPDPEYPDPNDDPANDPEPKDFHPNKTGCDPIELRSRAAYTNPFTDFSVETVGRLSLSRKYTSADASVRWSAAPGLFGRGWHHDWEAELSCNNVSYYGGETINTCRVSRGLGTAMTFGGVPRTVAALRQFAGENWIVYARTDVDVQAKGEHAYLARRPDDSNGGQRWIVFLPDGRELYFETVCDCAGGTDKYCVAPMPSSPSWYSSIVPGGRARLVKVVYPRGNAVSLSYDRSRGVLLSLMDEVGHRVDLRTAASNAAPVSACTGTPQAKVLEFDGTVYASYSYSGDQLTTVRLGDRTGPLLRAYEYDTARPGYLKAVKNAAGDPIAEFGYDSNGWATSLVDPASNLTVGYPDPQTTQIGYKAVEGSVNQKRGSGHAVSAMVNIDGAASQYVWDMQRYLRCSEDAVHRVHWYDRDTNGRITRHRQYSAGALTCTATPDRATAAPEVDESFEYGLTKPVADGISLALTTMTKASRRSALADQLSNSSDKTTFDTVYDYDPTPNADDPSGYACAPATFAGTVLCRKIEDGLTKDINGFVARQRRATFFSYDAHGRVVRTVGPMLVGYASDPAIPVEERTYWPDDESPARRGRLHEVKRFSSSGASPLVTTYDWDTFGPFQIIDPNGRITLIVHDNRGRVIARVTPDARSGSVRYYDEQEPRLVVLADGTTVRYQHDDKGRQTVMQLLSGDPEDASTTVTVGWSQRVTYDPFGNTSTVALADASGLVWWLQQQRYNSDHRLLAEIHPEGAGVASFGYDPSGVLTTITDAEGRITQIALDGIGRPTSLRRRMADESLGITPVDVASYAYDPGRDALRSVTDDRGNVTSYEHDDFGGVLSVASGGTFKAGPWRYAYDARGAVAQRTNGIVSTSYQYDALGRLIQLSAENRTDSERILYTYEYDRAGDLGRLARIVEARRTTEFGYDEVGRVLSETVTETGIAAPLTTSYAWDANGYLGTLTYPSGLQVEYVRDAVTKTIIEVRNGATGMSYASEVSHWPGGPLHYARFGNGAALLQNFNLKYEPRVISNGPVYLSHDMTPAGNIGTVTDHGVTTTQYGYDLLDRLTAITRGGVTEAPQALRYEYAGDRVVAAYATAGTGARRYAFGYDDQANLSAVSEYDASGTTITQTVCLKHDALGRLVLFGRTAAGNGGPDRLACRTEADVTEVIARIEYDARNRRVARYGAATGSWTQFAFGPDGTVLGELARPASATDGWTTVRDYVWLDATPLAQLEYAGPDRLNERQFYFHVDHLGFPRALTDAAGQVAWRADVRPSGELSEDAGATVVTNLRLPGQYDERLFAAAGISGMQGPYFNWSRWYLPSMGRYMEPDPIAMAGGFNGDFGPDWYGYAGQNPLRWVDPLGLSRNDWWDPRFYWYTWGDVFGTARDFWRNYGDMRDANTINADKYFHCMANCEASSRGWAGVQMADDISETREWIDENFKGDPRWACDQDRAANARGRNRQPAGSSCQTVCGPLRPTGLPPRY